MTRRRLRLADASDAQRAADAALPHGYAPATLSDADGERLAAWLQDYDLIVVSSSAGKDSQTALDVVSEIAERAGVAGRVVVLHCDLGRVEWPGTRELAERQAAHYGHPFRVTSRIGRTCTSRPRGDVPLYALGERYGDLLDQVERRHAQLQAAGKDAAPWPSRDSRWCTSDFKRAPSERAFTALAAEWRRAHPAEAQERPCRILDVQGLRAQESPSRAKQAQLRQRKATARQIVHTWLPIKWWTEEQVWERILDRDLEYHWAYDAGMPRLSCAFCVFASRDALMIAGELLPDLLDAYVRVERRVGYTFRQDLSLADVQAALAAGEQPGTPTAWTA